MDTGKVKDLRKLNQDIPKLIVKQQDLERQRDEHKHDRRQTIDATCIKGKKSREGKIQEVQDQIEELGEGPETNQQQLRLLMAERKDLLIGNSSLEPAERNARLLELKPQIEEFEKQVDAEQDKINGLRQRLKVLMEQSTQDAEDARKAHAKNLKGEIAELEAKLQPVLDDLDEKTAARFEIVDRAINKIYRAHEASLREAVLAGGRDIIDGAKDLIDLPPPASGESIVVEPALNEYLRQEETPNGKERLRNLRFNIFNTAGYTRFRLAAFRRDTQRGGESAEEADTENQQGKGPPEEAGTVEKSVETLLDEADKLLRLAQKANPNHFHVWLNRGLVCLDRRHKDGNSRIDEAERCLRQAVALQPNDYYSREQLALALRRRLERTGVVEYMKKTIEEGRDQVQKSIELRPGNQNPHVLQAEFLTMLWELEPAEREKWGGEVDGALRRGYRHRNERYPGCRYPDWEWVSIIRKTQQLSEAAEAIGTAAAGAEKEEKFDSEVAALRESLDRLIRGCDAEADYFWLAQDYVVYFRLIRSWADILRKRIDEAEGRRDRFEAWTDVKIPHSAPRDPASTDGSSS
jgi:hypothetical protein